MAQSTVAAKGMTFGEGGSALTFAALAMLSIVAAAKAYTPEYAFHAYLFAAAIAAAVFKIIDRYCDRPGRAALAYYRRQADLQFWTGQIRDRRRYVLNKRSRPSSSIFSTA